MSAAAKARPSNRKGVRLTQEEKDALRAKRETAKTLRVAA
jgi:hypothetical protein